MDTKAAIALLPCNGLSARGRLAREAARMLREGMEQLQQIDMVPLMAGLPKETEQLREARFVMGLAGCEHRCDQNACQQALQRPPDDAFVIGDIVREEVHEIDELSEEEKQQYLLDITSQLLGRLSRSESPFGPA